MFRKFFNLATSNNSNFLRNQFYSSKFINLKNNQTSLEIVVADENLNEKVLKFNPLWLRFNCHAVHSKQPQTGQIIINKDEIPSDLRISSAKLDKSNNLVIKWDKVSNQPNSILPFEFIVNNCPANIEPNTKEQRFKTSKSLNYFDYNKFNHKDGNKNKLEIFNWQKCIAEYGISILKNVGTEEKTVKRIAELIAPVHSTIYGELFHVKVDKDPINIAYSNAALGFHIDLNYYESPPGLQFLHCIRFDPQIEGGESIFLDSFEMAEQFRLEYPAEFESLTKIPATFQKIHFNRDRPVCMIYQRPHIVLNENGQITGVNWAPPFEGPLRSSDEKQMKAYHESYLKLSKFINNNPNIIEYKLKEGEIACFNNRRFFHARRAFNANDGIRHLEGCYVNIDEFKSELLANEYRVTKQLDEGKMRAYKPYDIPQMKLGKIAFGNHDYF